MNQRQIRFRVWDKKKKVIIDLQNKNYILNTEDGWHVLKYMTALDGYSPDDYYPFYDESNSVLMQFTGLHDKNGKEIWEGDILYDKYSNLVNQLKRTECLSREEFKKVEVFWDIGMGRWGVGNKIGVSSLEFVIEDSEVIGNVWKNPELMGCV